MSELEGLGEAFELIRRVSRNQRVPAREIAAELLASSETPTSILEAHDK